MASFSRSTWTVILVLSMEYASMPNQTQNVDLVFYCILHLNALQRTRICPSLGLRSVFIWRAEPSGNVQLWYLNRIAMMTVKSTAMLSCIFHCSLPSIDICLRQHANMSVVRNLNCDLSSLLVTEGSYSLYNSNGKNDLVQKMSSHMLRISPPRR